jgi:glycine cleavage system H protein
MSDIPAELRYTAQHEWVRRSEGSQTIRIGITDYAQSALGDVVYVSLPEPGAVVDAGAAVGEVESTKSVSDVYAPLTGTVTARNEALDTSPDLVNSDPYGEGWLVEIELPPDSDLGGLLDADAYAALANDQA